MQFYQNLMVGTQEIPCFLKPSTRAKYLRAAINQNNHLVVTVPINLRGMARIDSFLQKCYPWLLKQSLSIKTIRKPRPFVDQGQISILGQMFNLTFLPRGKHELSMVNQIDDQIIVKAPDGMHTAYLRDWLKVEAQKKFSYWSEEMAKKINQKIAQVRLAQFKSKWGSCRSDGVISYSYHLIFAPEEVARYVCAHEVAHLKYMHHQPIFWELVEKLHPSYRQEYAWLKKNGAGLHMWGKETV